MKENVLVSTCLLGKRDKYNGYDNLSEQVVALKSKYNFIPVCPEVIGGLSTPRNPAEQQGDKVIDNQGNDVTLQFVDGAKKVLAIAQKHNCTKAILKAKSPSCGANKVYDGTFTKTLIDGHGVTAKLLIDNGIQVFNENDIEKL